MSLRQRDLDLNERIRVVYDYLKIAEAARERTDWAEFHWCVRYLSLVLDQIEQELTRKRAS